MTEQNGQKLNLGCGRDIREGWVNLDCVQLPGVDVVADLDDCANTPLPFEDDTFDAIVASHLIEHIRNTLPLMQELHRIAKPGAGAVFQLPYGSSDDAFEDPTHVRPYFLGSFMPFSQPYYWRADYGYRGDWNVDAIHVLVAPAMKDKQAAEIMDYVQTGRNVVRELSVELRAVKPIREPRAELQTPPNITLHVADS
jgi:SAM-dependent methyltransferase